VAVAPSSLRRSNACWILLGSAGCFLVLALSVMLLDPFPGDATARLWLLGYGSPGVVQVMRVINYLGNWRLLLPGTILIFVVFPKARARWWVWIALMITAPAAEGLLKILVGRARPEEASMGFPSGHATAAAAFFGAVIYLAASLPSRARVLVRAIRVRHDGLPAAQHFRRLGLRCDARRHLHAELGGERREHVLSILGAAREIDRHARR